jgi:hypothetical protein
VKVVATCLATSKLSMTALPSGISRSGTLAD